MKMVVAWHDAAFTTPDLLLTPEILDRILRKFQLQQKLKTTWTRSEALIYEKMITLDDSMTGHQTVEVKADGSGDDILEQISDERIKMKEMRERTEAETKL